MTNSRTRTMGFVGRFLGSWRLALGELVIIALGVMIALWADQAIQARQEAALAISHLERLQTDIRADAEQILERMRSRPNFEGYLRDGMYWAHLSAQLLDGVAISARELDAAIDQELKTLRR